VISTLPNKFSSFSDLLLCGRVISHPFVTSHQSGSVRLVVMWATAAIRWSEWKTWEITWCLLLLVGTRLAQSNRTYWLDR